MPKKAAKKIARNKPKAQASKPTAIEELDELLGESQATPQVQLPAGASLGQSTPTPQPVQVKAKADTHVQQLRTGIPEASIPVCPIKGADDLGDKDPEVMAWWEKNHPDLFEKKYQGRKTNG